MRKRRKNKRKVVYIDDSHRYNGKMIFDLKSEILHPALEIIKIGIIAGIVFFLLYHIFLN